MNDARPDLDEIEACFTAVVEGRTSRDQADRWAARWLLDDSLDWSDTELWALDLLFGIDLRHGPGRDYLHSDEQVREWLQELRKKREELIATHNKELGRTCPTQLSGLGSDL